MLIDFVKGTQRTLSRNDLLELYLPDSREKIPEDKYHIGELSFVYIIRYDSKDVFSVGSTSYSMREEWFLVIDEVNKFIFVNKENLELLARIIHSDDYKLVSYLEDFKVIDVSAFIDSMNKVYSDCEEEFLEKHKEKICNYVDSLISDNNTSGLEIEKSIAALFNKCYVYNTKPEIPKILKREEVNPLSFENQKLYCNYIFNDSFFKDLENILLDKTLKHSSQACDIYVYFKVRELLQEDKPSEHDSLCRKIYNATKDEGLTLTVTLKDNSIIKVKNEFELPGFFPNMKGYCSTNIDDIKKITFGRKTLFELE